MFGTGQPRFCLLCSAREIPSIRLLRIHRAVGCPVSCLGIAAVPSDTHDLKQRCRSASEVSQDARQTRFRHGGMRDSQAVWRRECKLGCNLVSLSLGEGVWAVQVG